MLSIEHLYFSYQGQPPYVLNDLNLHIHSGDYISIVGDNGCGKSTLLRLILGFLTPVKGSIKRSTNNIRYVSQKNDFSHAGFPITVKEILDSYRKLLKSGVLWLWQFSQPQPRPALQPPLPAY